MAGKGKAQSARSTLDLEAIGLVLLALGIFVLGFLLPNLPTGDLGRTLRAMVVDRLGWGGWALPIPLIVLGGLFLLKRNPRAWPRMLLGYLLFCAGVWSALMLIAPQTAGVWGMQLRARLDGVAGALAWLPVLLLVTIGFELFVGWRPTRIVRSGAIGVARGVRGAFRGFLSARARMRERAAFNADVALVRRDLHDLDRDLQALATLYPSSGELDRWREAVQQTSATLRRADDELLADARADLKAWTSAVRSFAKDRAEELRVQLDAEGIEDFVAWSKGVAAEFNDPIEGVAPHARAVGSARNTSAAGAARDARATQVAKTPRALDQLRKACALDTTAVGERYRRLVRDRDLATSGLKKMTPRELAAASRAHGERVKHYAAVAEDAAALDETADLLEPWRGLAQKVARLRAEFPDDEELADLDATLAEELRQQGRATLGQLEAWNRALEAVELRTRQRAQEAARAAAAAAADDEEVGEEDGAGDDAAGSVGAGAAPEADPAPADDWAEAWDTDEAVPVPGDAPRAPPVEDNPPWLVGSPGAGIEVAATGARGATAVAVPAAPDEDGAEARPDTPAVGGIPIQVPGFDLLDESEEEAEDPEALAREVQIRVRKIDETLANFNLQGRVVSSVRGPTVTRFEVEPAPGEKISRFANLSDDLALAMAVGSVRIEAPIPGKSVIGLEVPNATRDLIRFRRAAEAGSFKRSKARLPLILGNSIDGEMVVGDLAKMPHLLIAGSTGSGKSVAVNTLIGSLVFKFLPTDLRFLMIDPKMVELTPFDGIPHLIRPVVTNPNDAAGVLLGAVAHMERRYKMMSKIGAKNLDQYNEKAKNLDLPQLPFVIIVIDELADLMITSPKEVESAIMRLAQMARATGMHLVLATQRPSVDILTSLIKVNVPARIAFAVSSGHDSRTILDTMGAERLIGMGDMLFYQPGLVKPVRLQGPFISEAEIATIAGFLRRQYFDDEFVEAYGDDFDPPQLHTADADGMIDWNDDKLRDAADLVVEEGQASVSRLQRRLSVGHARAGKLMDSLEALGVVGPHAGSKPRDVLVDIDELPNIFGK